MDLELEKDPQRRVAKPQRVSQAPRSRATSFLLFTMELENYSARTQHVCLHASLKRRWSVILFGFIARAHSNALDATKFLGLVCLWIDIWREAAWARASKRAGRPLPGSGGKKQHLPPVRLNGVGQHHSYNCVTVHWRTTIRNFISLLFVAFILTCCLISWQLSEFKQKEFNLLLNKYIPVFHESSVIVFNYGNALNLPLFLKIRSQCYE